MVFKAVSRVVKAAGSGAMPVSSVVKSVFDVVAASGGFKAKFCVVKTV